MKLEKKMQQHHKLQMKPGCQESNLQPSFSEVKGQTTEKRLSFNKANKKVMLESFYHMKKQNHNHSMVCLTLSDNIE